MTALDLSRIPGPAPRRIALRLTTPAERALRGGHPWLFESGITEQSHEGEAGDLGVAFDRKGRFLAIGLYDPTSPIRMRVLQHRTPALIDQGWFRERIQRAAELRKPILRQDTDGYRLLHGESDLLPALVVDRYRDILVMKIYSPAWIPHLGTLVPALEEVMPFHHLVIRLGRSLQERPELLHGVEEGSVLSRSPDPLVPPLHFTENGLEFEVDPFLGQKTGFFLDQRENRARVGGLARDARTVLNVFAYTGGFSVYAARAGAERVTSLDQSAPALAAARRNFELNRGVGKTGKCDHEILQGDAFELLARLREGGRRSDMVILDPPSFAKEQGEIERAIGSYERLCALGLRVLRPGGTLVAASCSSRIDEETFFSAIHRAAVREGRPLQEIDRTGHPIDHPFHPDFPEGAYLKCLFATG